MIINGDFQLSLPKKLGRKISKFVHKTSGFSCQNIFEGQNRKRGHISCIEYTCELKILKNVQDNSVHNFAISTAEELTC